MTQIKITSLAKFENTRLRAGLGWTDTMSTALDMLSVKVQENPGRAEDDNSGLRLVLLYLSERHCQGNKRTRSKVEFW